MANQFKSGKEAAGYLFDVAVRKGKAAAQREYERLFSSIPENQLKDFNNSLISINSQKNISDDEGLGAAKVQRYREKAAKGMSVDYDTEFAPKPTVKTPPKATQAPAAAPKPAAKETTELAPPEIRNNPFHTKMAAMKKEALAKQKEREAAAQKKAAPVTSVNSILKIKGDTPPAGSRPAIGGSTLQMPTFVPKK